MAQLAIKGHPTRGNEVIEILEMLGGVNFYKISSANLDLLYTIRSLDNFIIGVYPTNTFAVFTLEEFLEKFPYKVGDKVTLGKFPCEIKGMSWEYDDIIYYVEGTDFSKEVYSKDKDLQPYKEETMEEIKVDIPKGYEFAGVDDTTQQVMFTKIQPEYPKTFDECSVVLSELPHTTLISSFYKLLVCRDAYWQIADWKFNYDEKCYYLCPELGEIQKYEGVCDCNAVLAFPTKEIRDMFLDNFRELINQCKELL